MADDQKATTDGDIASVELLKQLDSRDLAVLHHLAQMNYWRKIGLGFDQAKNPKEWRQADDTFAHHKSWLQERRIPIFLNEKDDLWHLGSYW